MKGFITKINVTRKIPYLKFDKRAFRYVILFNFVGTFQKQCFVWCHFVKNNPLN
ncbi:unnamed protein product [Schistosoma mattheei]|uniref:Uncharacterized protein n=1 Tax=Schistosoma mattheei TaxID=31246 RepID=A0A3P8KHP3_9TREM|nr:unnamed protein product [Schistosoma mattheei]